MEAASSEAGEEAVASVMGFGVCLVCLVVLALLLSDVLVYALGHQCLHILALMADIEQLTRAQCVLQRVVQLFEVVEHFGGDDGGEVASLECVVLVQRLDARDGCSDLRPEAVDERIELIQSVLLQNWIGLVQQREDARGTGQHRTRTHD